jgi:general secretion pathway protein G
VREEGLTLVEVLVTMTIVVLLASVAMPLSKVSTTRTHEIELRQELRIIRGAIDLFKSEWNRDGDVLLGPVCLKNKLVCKEVAGAYGYPKSLEVLLGVKLTGEEATVRGTTVRRYLRVMPVDPLTGRPDWLLRCYKDGPKPTSWCGEDVYDVMTQSEATALDGTKYQDW